MAHFYHFSDDEMENMIGDTFQDYWLAIDAIESNNLLNQLNLFVYTSVKKNDRERIFNVLNKKAQSIIDDSNRAVLSTEDAAKKLAQHLLNG